MEERPAGNTGLAKVAVQCSADTFVVNQNLVLRIGKFGLCDQAFPVFIDQETF